MFISSHDLNSSIAALSRCGANRNLFAYLILRRMMVLYTNDHGDLVLAGKQCKDAIDEAALIGCGDKRYYNPFDQKNPILSERWWSNGPTDNLKNWGSRTSILDRVQDAKNVTVKVAPYDGEEVKRFLTISDENKPRVVDIALWWFRHRNFGTPDGERELYTPHLIHQFAQELNLGSQELADLFLFSEDNNGVIELEESEARPIDYIPQLMNNSLETGACSNQISEPRNLIFFGAPGTGKSHNLNKLAETNFSDNHIRRVTFYPDYTYSQFVGCFKPMTVKTKDEDGKTTSEISYRYVLGPFLETYVNAAKNPEQNYLLIVEEINRANPAAVFGDVFQLLDRDKDGASAYDVDAPSEMRDRLADELGAEVDKLKIPANMFIWATMNSADQGVFPMDTAFKRRWSFRYIGIDDGEDAEIDGEKLSDKVVTCGGRRVYWNRLRKAINDLMAHDCDINEDKLLGPFFLDPSALNDEQFADAFKDKVLMYLYEDAGKARRKTLFREKGITYSQLCSAFDREGELIFGGNFDDWGILADQEYEIDDEQSTE